MVLYMLCKLASLAWIRQRCLPTDEKRDAAHLASATDRHELEFHIREPDRSRRQRRGPSHHI